MFIYYVVLLIFVFRYEGDLIGTVIGTLEDYFETEIQDYLMESYIRRFVC